MKQDANPTEKLSVDRTANGEAYVQLLGYHGDVLRIEDNPRVGTDVVRLSIEYPAQGGQLMSVCLRKDQIASLLPVLQRFVNTGSIARGVMPDPTTVAGG